VINPAYCDGGVPWEILKQREPIEIQNWEYLESIARVQIAYTGHLEDEILAYELPADDGFFELPARILLFRLDADPERAVGSVAKDIFVRKSSSDEPQYITFNECSEREWRLVNLQKPFLEKLKSFLKYFF